MISAPKEFGEQAYEFLLGFKAGTYYRIPRQILGTNSDVLFHKNMNIRANLFTATLHIPILPKVSDL